MATTTKKKTTKAPARKKTARKKVPRKSSAAKAAHTFVVPDDMHTLEIPERKRVFRTLLTGMKVQVPQKAKIKEVYALYEKALRALKVEPPYLCIHGYSFETKGKTKCPRCIASMAKRVNGDALDAKEETALLTEEQVNRAIEAKRAAKAAKPAVRKQTKSKVSPKVQRPSRDTRSVRILVKKDVYKKSNPDLSIWVKYLLNEQPKAVKDIWADLVEEEKGTVDEYSEKKPATVKYFYEVDLALLLENNFIKLGKQK